MNSEKFKTLFTQLTVCDVWEKYRKNHSDLIIQNPVLLKGQIQILEDRLNAGLPCIKIGNGVDKYTDLPFLEINIEGENEMLTSDEIRKITQELNKKLNPELEVKSDSKRNLEEEINKLSDVAKHLYSNAIDDLEMPNMEYYLLDTIIEFDKKYQKIITLNKLFKIKKQMIVLMKDMENKYIECSSNVKAHVTKIMRNIDIALHDSIDSLAHNTMISTQSQKKPEFSTAYNFWDGANDRLNRFIAIEDPDEDDYDIEYKGDKIIQ